MSDEWKIRRARPVQEVLLHQKHEDISVTKYASLQVSYPASYMQLVIEARELAFSKGLVFALTF